LKALENWNDFSAHYQISSQERVFQLKQKVFKKNIINFKWTRSPSPFDQVN